MSRSLRTIALLIALALVVASCGDDAEPAGGASSTPPTTAGPVALTLLTHDSFAVSDAVLAAFTDRTGVSVEILRGGDAGTVVNQAILTRDNPVADVLFGIDSTFLSRALEEDVFSPYTSPNLSAVPAELQVDPEHRVTPIDFGDVCVNYDKAALDGLGLEAPTTLQDLTLPAYQGLLVVEDAAVSSPGLAFLLATIGTFGQDGWVAYWEALRANDVLVVSDWEQAYYSAFSGGAGTGDRPLVVSYASSPPAEVVFAETRPEEAPTGSMAHGCYRQIEFAGVLRGTPYPDAAAELVDFMLSLEFQEDIPLQMFVYPARSDATLPEVFVANTTAPVDPVILPPDEIAANRDVWISTWTDTMR
jgi:thiamine transport system substrate-binding protein